MNRMSTKSRVFRMTSVLGMVALLGGLATLTPAHADDWRDHRDHIRYDVNALHRDQAHLRDLYHRKAVLTNHHDWDGVRRVNAAITTTRWRIAHRRFDINHDVDTFYSDHDRDWFHHNYR